LSGVISLRVPAEWKKRLEDRAQITGKTMTEIIVDAVNGSIGPPSEAAERILSVKEAETLSARIIEMDDKNHEELEKAALLMQFYGVFEPKEPLRCMGQALSDFGEHEGEWFMSGWNKPISFERPEEVVRALTLADSYVALDKKLGAATSKICVPLENWEETLKKREEIQKKKVEERRLAEEKQRKAYEEKWKKEEEARERRRKERALKKTKGKPEEKDRKNNEEGWDEEDEEEDEDDWGGDEENAKKVGPRWVEKIAKDGSTFLMPVEDEAKKEDGKEETGEGNAKDWEEESEEEEDWEKELREDEEKKTMKERG